MENFDQIMPLNISGNEVAGYINVLGEEFYVHLKVQDTTNPRKVHLRGCKKVNELLEPILDNLKQHLHQSGTLNDMLYEIQNAIEQQIRSKGISYSMEPQSEYNALLEQLHTCGWDNKSSIIWKAQEIPLTVHYISPDFHAVHLKYVDESYREHILKIWIPEKFPNEGPRYECDLPEEFKYKWLPGDTLAEMFNAFSENLMKFSEFWSIMDEIDSKTWVLEPEKPRRKDCRRRIVIGSGISLLLIINPLMPSTIPTCHYLGPERIVEPVREKFNKNIRLWSEYESVLHNLQQVLEIEFPSPVSSVKEEFCLECGICYSYQLGDAIPDMTCDDPNCNQPFHHACLYEYIRMLPDVRSSFNKLFGECPYCSKPLWCTIP